LHFFCLTMDRARLYERINARVDQMMAQGLLAEVKAIWALGLPSDTPAMRAIGVKEFIPYFNGDIDLEEAVRTVKKNTRRFAKRQLTWFRRDPNLQWIDLDQVSREEAVQLIVEAYQAE
ncbi:MAG: tRNA (adenosine(37)-N6)-dimethylallyltransferase MiaA, partial [Clostridiales bacterium]|nr:tRNA (adenosine(37)-N6)-dimethylallyltransferase MiaA [Clostridiales bacterium]